MVTLGCVSAPSPIPGRHKAGDVGGALEGLRMRASNSPYYDPLARAFATGSVTALPGHHASLERPRGGS